MTGKSHPAFSEYAEHLQIQVPKQSRRGTVCQGVGNGFRPRDYAQEEQRTNKLKPNRFLHADPGRCQFKFGWIKPPPCHESELHQLRKD